jgi:nitrile hydratase subunit beta
MNGAHDMGGTMGYGPVKPEAGEPVFHAEWERRVRAMSSLMGRPGGWNIDMGRFARENINPRDYLARSYYEIWFAGLVRLLDERGLVRTDELAAGKSLHAPKPVNAIVKPEDIGPMLAAGRPSERPLNVPARFQIGDRVRALNSHPVGHTRLPRYVRGRTGVVTHLHGGHVFPDTNASGQGENPQWLFTVRFSGTELWGAAADPTVTVSVDAWESYLEAAA